jgi:PIN domain nuclease of toxin-antitoxin system
MRLLLDAHTFLWWVTNDPALKRRARAAIADVDNDCFLSHASVWEMAIKASLGKLKLPSPVGRFVADQCEVNNVHLLPITLAHVAAVERLPFHHRDPFDRLLVGQAQHEGLTLVSRDPLLKAYGLPVI